MEKWVIFLVEDGVELTVCMGDMTTHRNQKKKQKLKSAQKKY